MKGGGLDNLIHILETRFASGYRNFKASLRILSIARMSAHRADVGRPEN
jgi:hypothetical protein